MSDRPSRIASPSGPLGISALEGGLSGTGSSACAMGTAKTNAHNTIAHRCLAMHAIDTIMTIAFSTSTAARARGDRCVADPVPARRAAWLHALCRGYGGSAPDSFASPLL